MSKIRGKWLFDSFEQEIPAGTVNGVNAVFTLSSVPYTAKCVFLTLNGRPMRQGADYTINGANITMITAPSVGQELYAFYVKK
jgi:hypothetical protein